MNTDSTPVQVQQEKAGTVEAMLAGRLLLISSIIVNIIEGDNFLILASMISIAAGFLTIKAAKLEAVEQQIAPGVTTFANGLKLIGSHVGIAVSLILFWALLIEVSLRQPVGIAAGPTFAGSTGAFMV
ncbi:MAG TPA: hypothetical protein VEG39_15725 [Clostridia bacterium]|nr:hypothetical protein [Clostridia bacterium]